MKPMAHPLHVTESPADPDAQNSQTLLFVHGYGCDQSMWNDLLPLLGNHRRIVYDQPGAGQADPAAYDPERHASLSGYADSLLGLCHDLDLKNVVLIGHSVGATISAIAAAREPALFRRLILICPSPCYLNAPPHYMGGFERADIDALLQGLAQGQSEWSYALAPVIMGNPDQPALSDRLARSFCEMDPLIAQRWARATFMDDSRELFSRLGTDTLILQTREDAIAPEQVGQWLHAHLSQSTLILLDATGHCPHVSHPHAVADAMNQNLAVPP